MYCIFSVVQSRVRCLSPSDTDVLMRLGSSFGSFLVLKTSLLVGTFLPAYWTTKKESKVLLNKFEITWRLESYFFYLIWPGSSESGDMDKFYEIATNCIFILLFFIVSVCLIRILLEIHISIMYLNTGEESAKILYTWKPWHVNTCCCVFIMIWLVRYSWIILKFVAINPIKFTVHTYAYVACDSYKHTFMVLFYL